MSNSRRKKLLQTLTVTLKQGTGPVGEHCVRTGASPNAALDLAKHFRRLLSDFDVKGQCAV